MKSIAWCLNDKLKELCERVIQLDHINERLKPFLPENIRQNCHVGSFNKGTLVLVLSDAVWTSHLRYYLPELRDKLRTEGQLYQLVSIKLELASPSSLVPKLSPEKKKRVISAKAKSYLDQAAMSLKSLPLAPRA